MLSNRGRDQEEKQLRGSSVDRPVRNPLSMTPKHDDRMVYESHQRVSRMRQSDAVTDACAVQLLSLMQRSQQRQALRRLILQLGDLVNKLLEHRFAIETLET